MAFRAWWLGLFLALSSAPALAVDFYWAIGGEHFGSYQAALDKMCANKLYPTTYTSCEITKYTYPNNGNPASAKGDYKAFFKPSGTFEQGSFVVSRSGDGCTAPKVYDAAIGGCAAPPEPEPDPCEGKAGGFFSHEHRVGESGGTRTEPPSALCDAQCQGTFDYNVQDCRRSFVNGDLNGVTCVYRYKYNGTSCTDGDPSTPDIFDQPPSKPPTEAPPPGTFADSSCDNWVTNPDGTRTRSCTSTATSSTPGKVDCPPGPFVCTPTTPYPSYTETEKTGTQTEKANADGSSQSSSSTTTTTTKCRGTLPCESTSKTESESSGTNADGTPGDSSSNCTGEKCANGDGKGEEGEEGEDPGTCDPVSNPKGCEEEEKVSEVSGDACDATLACEGDAIQCAILRKEKEQACMWDYDKAKGTIEGEIAKSEYQLKEDDHDVSGLFSSAIGAARWLPSTCPPPEHFALSSGNGVSGQFSWQPTCDFASGLGPVLVAGACLFFAVYVGRGIGGGA